MTEIHLDLKNVFDAEAILSLFPASKEYEFTAKKVFRRKACLICSCGKSMVHNGYDYARKKGFGKARIGKQFCKSCGNQHHEDKGYWKNLLSQWQATITSLIMTLRNSHVAWEVISKVMGFLLPCSKGKSMHLFNNRIEQFEYPQENFLIVNYDEQHPKKGRAQKFRLTLLNYKTRTIIADELFDNKDNSTIEAFLRKHLDVEKKIVVITDCDRRYPAIFRKIWGDNVINQKCLLHLNKLVVTDFGRNTTLVNEYNKYLLLNIFYNRNSELKFMEKLLKKQEKKKFTDWKEKKNWVAEQKKKFYDYVRTLENARRREKKNLTQRTLHDAITTFEKVWNQRFLFSTKVQERIKMIKKNWEYFTAFYAVKDCPATNNAIENYYSTSLKTHRKKQMRTDRGLENHMKLSALKRTCDFSKPKNSLLVIYEWIKLIAV